MIFAGLIFTAFLIFLVLRIAQRKKQRKAVYNRAGTGRTAQNFTGLPGNNRKIAGSIIRENNRYIPVQESAPVKKLVLGEIKEEEEAVSTAKSGLEKINRLPRIQQAVVWAELLGRPRSEKEPPI